MRDTGTAHLNRCGRRRAATRIVTLSPTDQRNCWPGALFPSQRSDLNRGGSSSELADRVQLRLCAIGKRVTIHVEQH
jgi:hypothetical protein